MEEQFKAWMPVTKAKDGSFIGILSDTSIDRDEEFMSKELLESWAKNTSLKALANHENKMEKWVGGWSDLKVIEKNGKTALIAKPWFFSKEANPLADQIKKQVEEALDHGENAGISIGAIPKESCDKMIDGKKKKGFVKAELLEATWVPIQSNRNASFGHISKNFEIDEITKPKQVEDCVKSLLENSDFKPQDGKTKEESAWAVCQSKFGKECSLSFEKGMQEIKEEITMSEEIKKEEVLEQPKEVVEEKKEEVKVEEKLDESQKEIKEQIESLKKENEELKSLLKEINSIKKELEEVKSKGILKATVEQSPINKKQEVDVSVFGALKQKFQK